MEGLEVKTTSEFVPPIQLVCYDIPRRHSRVREEGASLDPGSWGRKPHRGWILFQVQCGIEEANADC